MLLYSPTIKDNIYLFSNNSKICMGPLLKEVVGFTGKDSGGSISISSKANLDTLIDTTIYGYDININSRYLNILNSLYPALYFYHSDTKNDDEMSAKILTSKINIVDTIEAGMHFMVPAGLRKFTFNTSLSEFNKIVIIDDDGITTNKSIKADGTLSVGGNSTIGGTLTAKGNISSTNGNLLAEKGSIIAKTGNVSYDFIVGNLLTATNLYVTNNAHVEKMLKIGNDAVRIENGDISLKGVIILKDPPEADLSNKSYGTGEPPTDDVHEGQLYFKIID